MTETVVHVTTLSQWHNVLDIWFGQGYSWNTGSREYKDIFFKDDAARYLQTWPDYTITYSSAPTYSTTAQLIEHYEFVIQQKEDSKMETCYVTQEQLDLIKHLKSMMFPMSNLIDNQDNRYDSLISGIKPNDELSILRYLGGDETIEFKVKEQLYRLWRVDNVGDKVYMNFTSSGNPDWTMSKEVAFTAPLYKIRNWQTPAWDIEEVE